MSIQPQYIDGKIVLNLDSEEEGKLLVSCAGGITTKSILPIEWISKKDNTTAYNLVIRGLKGGHSGMEIHLERGNSNKLMGRILKEFENELSFNLVSINGGSKNNAIPRECSAVITIDKDDERKLIEIKTRICNQLKKEFGKKDPDLRVHFLEIEEKVEKVFSDNFTKNIVNLLYLYPNGVNTLSAEIKGLTESSTNLGVVTTFENSIECESAVRSSVPSLKNEIVNRSKCITEILGGKFLTESPYPEWPYKTDSKIREICKDVYERMYGKIPEIVAIHAGVECGLFKEILGDDLDMISFGPDIFDVHTPNEHMSISSVERCYKYLLEILKEIK